MIVDAQGLALNIITIGITSLWVSIALISTLASFTLQLFDSFNANNRARLLWLIVVLPWIVALASVLLLLAPEIYEYRIDWLSSFIHWHHAYVFHIVSWHGALLMIFSTMFLIVSISKLVRAIRTNSRVGQLDFFSVSEQLNCGAFLVDSDTPQAFTAGLFYPRSYITHGLRDKLSKEKLVVVLQHELAHLWRRDPLRKYVFSLLTAFFPGWIGMRFNEAFSLSLEQLADQFALKLVGDKTLVSKTILDVARLNNNEISRAGLSAVECGFASNALQLRIRYLLDGEPMQPFPLVKIVASVLVTIAVSTLSVDFIHHSVETLFSH
jgi:Zn-dependent protease with chaperone function